MAIVVQPSPPMNSHHSSPSAEDTRPRLDAAGAASTTLVPFLDACKRAGISKAYAYALLAVDRWPRPVKIGRSSLIVEAELEAWISARIAERDIGERA